jgi:hypothetical protein
MPELNMLKLNTLKPQETHYKTHQNTSKLKFMINMQYKINIIIWLKKYIYIELLNHHVLKLSNSDIHFCSSSPWDF